MSAGADACSASGFQVVCVEADVQVTPSVVPGRPTVTCIGAPSVVPPGQHPCAPFTAVCGFTIAQQICVQVPILFEASSSVTAIRQSCQPASSTSCTPAPGCPFFEPKSQGFFAGRFNLTNFTASDICSAVKCLQLNAEVLSPLLPLCPQTGEDCAAFDLAACASSVASLLTPEGSGAGVLRLCGESNNALATVLRQEIAVLLGVCLCTTTLTGIQVGGGSLSYRVDLSGFPAETLAALGLTAACVSVGTVVAEANTILSNCDATLAGLMGPILGAMAQDAGVTIIQPVPC